MQKEICCRTREAPGVPGVGQQLWRYWEVPGYVVAACGEASVKIHGYYTPGTSAWLLEDRQVGQPNLEKQGRQLITLGESYQA